MFINSLDLLKIFRTAPIPHSYHLDKIKGAILL